MKQSLLQRWTREDLTRWNRAGLSALLYADGTAADHLEAIRLYLSGRFPARWGKELSPPFDPEALAADEAELEWFQHTADRKLIEQYFRESPDIGWQLARAFARSCHVLTQHIDAHANAAFLRTASEWEDLRKMVAMLGYSPVGATSATTMLAIDARAKGLVEKGLQLRHRPSDGGKAIIFETLEDIEVDPEVNAFTPAEGKISKTPLSEAEAAADPTDLPWAENPKAPMAPTDSALIVKDRDTPAAEAEAAWIKEKQAGRLRLFHEGDKWECWPLGRVTLMSSPRFRRKAWINGSRVRRTTVPHGLSPGSVVAWRMLGETDPLSWRFAEVERSDAFGLQLVDKKRAFDRYANDEAWPLTGDIEVRRASRLTGSYTVLAGEGLEAEKRVGWLAPFTARHALGETPISETVPSEWLDFNDDGVLVHPTTIDGQDEQFIKWLFKVSGIAASFPPSPLELVKIGAMMMVKDARIPSTGQLVFEAFLNLFGGGGDSVDTSDQSAVVPALFRFWAEEGEEIGDDVGGTSERPPIGKITGELWYLPKRHAGAGEGPAGDAESDFLVARNAHDGGWFFFDGKPSGLVPNGWAAARFASPADHPLWRAVRVLAIEAPLQSEDLSLAGQADPSKRYEQASAFAVKLELPKEIADTLPAGNTGFPDPADPQIPEFIELQGDYRSAAPPQGATRNEAPLAPPIKLDPCPTVELLGQNLLAINDVGLVQVVRVTSVNDDCTVVLEPQLREGFNEGNLRLLGNFVRAGHGERQPPVRLGPGTGAERRSRLLLEQRDVSTVPDTRVLHGAREDLDVRIDGALWHQVNRLDDSRATDRHYAVATTEQGFLELTFGDGRTGRALPPGNNNVQIRYRTGAGRRGGVARGSLEQLVNPHPLVRGVIQPVDAIGGADMEAPEEMRERAPASTLALERAVSLPDFEQLAMQHRGVSQASASYRIGSGGGFDRLVVVALSADGREIDPEMAAELAAYLQRWAVPTLRVEVEKHAAIKVRVEITIRLDYATFEPDKLATSVKRLVAERFSAERRKIGTPLHLSELYAAVEGVEGVENSVCEIVEPSGSGQVVGAHRHELAAIPDQTWVQCSPEEYTP